MKNLLSILLVSIILMGCSEKRLLKDDLEDIKGDYFSEEIAITKYDRDELTIYRFKKIGNKLIRSKYELYYNNGQQKVERNYKDGEKVDVPSNWLEMKDGLYKDWYENGQLASEGNYKDGKKDGLQSWRRINGQIEIEENYKDGKRID